MSSVCGSGIGGVNMVVVEMVDAFESLDGKPHRQGSPVVWNALAAQIA